jgi:hypothetical protein
MATYASLARVKQIIDATTEPDTATFDALNEVASRELDRACAVTSFDPDAAPGSITIRQGDLCGAPCGSSPCLVLPIPVRTITSVTIDGVATTDYRPIYVDLAGRAHGLEATGATVWYGEIVVTGDVGSGAALDGEGTAATPAEIVEAASVIVAGYLRKDRAADGEVSGPEGLTFRPGNPWNDERVKRAIVRYRVAPPLAV